MEELAAFMVAAAEVVAFQAQLTFTVAKVLLFSTTSPSLQSQQPAISFLCFNQK